MCKSTNWIEREYNYKQKKLRRELKRKIQETRAKKTTEKPKKLKDPRNKIQKRTNLESRRYNGVPLSKFLGICFIYTH